MTIPIHHLAGIESTFLRTSRLQIHTLTSGPADGEPVLFLHGNLASSTFWEETMLALPPRFRAVAPDLRGYGLTDPSIRIDAAKGVGQWADDVLALADELGWDRFHLAAHSLGGCVAWALLGLHSERIASVALVAPGPPCGFGGARGPGGELNFADGAGSGAGLALPRLVELIAAGERGSASEMFSPRGVMNRLYWNPPFHPPREEELLTAMLQVHSGDGHFPGDSRPSAHWPGFAPGDFGPINAISPLYNQWVLPRLAESLDKPRLLWVHGADDPVMCDGSPSDVGTQGKLGLRGDWPGEDVFPPQPLLTQVAYALDQYALCGGIVQHQVLPDVGHTPYLEEPSQFQKMLADHLSTGQ